MTTPGEFTRILQDLEHDQPGASADLIRVVYDELRKLASAHLRPERAGHTLQTTALVHEAYLRLFSGVEPQWQNRSHFFGAASSAMRRIVDYARERGAAKRGGHLERVPLEGVADLSMEGSLGVLAIDEALEVLAKEEPQRARLVELRYFGGLTMEETARALGTSPRSADRQWAFAKAWIYRRLEES